MLALTAAGCHWMIWGTRSSSVTAVIAALERLFVPRAVLEAAALCVVSTNVGVAHGSCQASGSVTSAVVPVDNAGQGSRCGGRSC
jgi:hypothetical protein